MAVDENSAHDDTVKRPWYTKKRVMIPLTLLAVIGIGGQLAGNQSTGTDTTAAGQKTAGTKGKGQQNGSEATKVEAQEGGDAKQAAVGQAVRDGKLEFVVSAPKCGAATLGNDYLGTKAQGEFCLVPLKVTNIGDEAQTLSGSSQKARDSKGREYSVDTEAAIYLKDSNTLLEQINPGNTVKGTIVFDVPKGTSLTEIELHDSPFSGGVKVTL